MHQYLSDQEQSHDLPTPLMERHQLATKQVFNTSYSLHIKNSFMTTIQWIMANAMHEGSK